MIWFICFVMAFGLFIVGIRSTGLRFQLAAEKLRRLAVEAERDNALAGYDCLANQHEELMAAMRATDPASSLINGDDIEDVEVDPREVAMLDDLYYNVPAAEKDS